MTFGFHSHHECLFGIANRVTSLLKAIDNPVDTKPNYYSRTSVYVVCVCVCVCVGGGGGGGGGGGVIKLPKLIRLTI